MYKKASILLLNNMCMLLSVGFIMLCRLDVCHSYQTAGDRSRGECGGTGRAGSDPEDEISEGSDLDLCRNRYCPAGSSSCAGQNQLRCEAFPYREFSRLRRSRSRSCSLWRRCLRRGADFQKGGTGHGCGGYFMWEFWCFPETWEVR